MTHREKLRQEIKLLWQKLNSQLSDTRYLIGQNIQGDTWLHKWNIDNLKISAHVLGQQMEINTDISNNSFVYSPYLSYTSKKEEEKKWEIVNTTQTLCKTAKFISE